MKERRREKAFVKSAKAIFRKCNALLRASKRGEEVPGSHKTFSKTRISNGRDNSFTKAGICRMLAGMNCQSFVKVFPSVTLFLV